MPLRPVVVGDPDPVFRALFRRITWAFALLGAILGAILGAAWIFATPQTYKATVAIELTQAAPQVNISGIGQKANPVSMDTDAQIVLSDAVVDAVADVDRRSTGEVRGNLMVAARPLTQVMTITYAARTADGAVAGAAAAADVFLSERERLIIEPVREYLSTITAQSVSRTGVTEKGVTEQTETNLWSLELRRQAALTGNLMLQGPGAILEDARITSASKLGDLDVPVATAIGLGALMALTISVAREIKHRRRLSAIEVRRTAWT